MMEGEAGSESMGDGAGPFEPTRVEKPWGHELIWAHTDRYVGKVLHVKEGHALSLQYHERKDETLHLLRGRMRFQVGRQADALEETVVEAGWSFRLTPGTIHRMEALTDVDILEASTSELEDVVRLEDRYGRV
jgi:mannose-6-phosphate isomerase